MWSVNGIRELLRFARKHDGPWEYECKDDEFLPHEEDAEIIAASIELLEALKTMVEMVEMNGFGKALAMDVAKAAIVQASRKGNPKDEM